jgi:hypothetical protein
MRKKVCVDLDGVLADYSQGWQGVENIGDPIPGAVEFTRSLSTGADVVIHTVRCNPEAQKGSGLSAAQLHDNVKAWLDKHGFAYTEIYTGAGKPMAAAYVDDRAVRCRPPSRSESDIFTPEDDPFNELRALIYANTLKDALTLCDQAHQLDAGYWHEEAVSI